MAQPDVALTQQDFDKLVQLLADLDIFQDVAGRRTLIKLAKLDETIPNTDLVGLPLVVARDLLRTVVGLARDASGEIPLGRFLVTLKPHLNFNLQHSQLIDSILEHYSLFPVARELPVEIPMPASSSEYPAFQQETLKRDTMREITFFWQGIKASRAVVFIKVDNRCMPEEPRNWTGTGFLIGPRLLLTNWHVLKDRCLLPSTTFLLNHERRPNGGFESPIVAHAEPSGFYYANEEFDYALIELRDYRHREATYLPLHPKVPVVINERVNIIGHPDGGPKTISIQDNFLLGIQDQFILYSTSTTYGSSGSPVLNDDWTVVGLHSQGGFTTERNPATGRFEQVPLNRGIAASAIYADMHAYVASKAGQKKALSRLIPWWVT